VAVDATKGFVMSDQQAIAKWLKARGWRKNRLGWWFMPVPGWGNRMVVVGQEIFTLATAFERQRLVEAGKYPVKLTTQQPSGAA
jgi:hypothetical protein